MEIITKQKNKYTYLYTKQEDNIAIYYEEKSQKFYTFKNQSFDKKWGFAALFLAPLNLFLNNDAFGNLMVNYLLSCFFGIILGAICLSLLRHSYSSNQFIGIEVDIKEVESFLVNLKKIKEIKIALLLSWVIFFILMSVMFFDKKNYTSLLCLSILSCFLLPIIANLNFIKHRRITKCLQGLLTQKKANN